MSRRPRFGYEMNMKRCVIAVLCVLSAGLSAQNCAGTSVPGLVPLNDLGVGTYQSFSGGLYPNGSNVVPSSHLALGLASAAQVQPRDLAGNPSPTGKIVLLSVGMSNTTNEYSVFVPQANADPNKNPAVVPIDGAQGGQTAAIIQNPNANFWTVIQQRLLNAGVAGPQVQVVWLKEADAVPTAGFPAATNTLRNELKAICQVLKQKYPNVALCFLSSRTYAGYATTTLNPEPYAYESGFAVKWTIESQLNGDPAMNADPAMGAVVAPWVGWGPYLWANGTTPRSDGLTWLCSDFQPDGTHPGTTGRQKVANMLSAHFGTHPVSTPWYLGTGGGIPTAQLTFYGLGCPGTNGIPNIVTNSLPVLGNPDFRIGIQNARPASAATLFLSAAQAQIPIGGGFFAWVDVFPPSLLLPAPATQSTLTTSAFGSGFFSFAIPNLATIGGLHLYAEWVVFDPLGALNGQAALTRALDVRFGQ